MTSLYGILGLSDVDRSFVNTLGQRVVYDAVQTYLGYYNMDVQAAIGVFAEGTTEDFKIRYRLPGGGRMQRRGTKAQSGAVKGGGAWDVAFPLEDFGDQVAGDDITMAYLTIGELQTHIDTVRIRDLNTVRFEMLFALFNNTARPFADPIRGTLTVQPLANNDATVYPPVLGSEAETTQDHYLVSGYVATAISDTNNPYAVITNRLEGRFGAVQGGSNTVAFINPDEVPETEALTDFDPVNDRFTTPGQDTAQLSALPANLPGRVIGRTNGLWVAEWRYVPSGYILAVDLDAPRPLMQRVDPAATGLAQGLQLVSRDAAYPFEAAHYRHRFGFGVGNRLNGVVMQLKASGTYDIPAAYV